MKIQRSTDTNPLTGDGTGGRESLLGTTAGPLHSTTQYLDDYLPMRYLVSGDRLDSGHPCLVYSRGTLFRVSRLEHGDASV